MAAKLFGMKASVERLVRFKWFLRTSSAIQFILDALSWSLAAFVASYTRFSIQGHFDPYGATKDSLTSVLPVVLVVMALTGFCVGIYRRRWRYGSFDEIAGLIKSATITTFVMMMLRFLDSSSDAFPRSVIISAGIAGLF